MFNTRTLLSVAAVTVAIVALSATALRRQRPDQAGDQGLARRRRRQQQQPLFDPGQNQHHQREDSWAAPG